MDLRTDGSIPEYLPDRMPEHMSDRMPEYLPDRMPEKMSKYTSIHAR